jgi:hypothetical protein
MEFAILEVTHIDPTISLVPLEPSRAIYHIIFEETTQNPNLRMQRSLPFLLAVRKLASVANLLIRTVVVPKAMHPPVHELAPIGLPCH